MDTATIESMVDYFLPVMTTAGRYALAIQADICGPSSKPGANAWTQAVTDADLGVQTCLEAATLARFPGVGFFGEEDERSINHKYFDPAARTIVCVDPINGTYLYQNQRDGWDIILSIVHERRLMAAISLMPARDLFYAAVRGAGARTGRASEPRRDAMTPLRTRAGSRWCMTYRASGVAERLRPAFDCFDIVEDDDPARGVDSLNDLFTGRLDAFICRGGDLLDWGAIAFIAAAAGGAVSHLDGSPLDELDDYVPQAQSDLLVAADEITHREILRLLSR